MDTASALSLVAGTVCVLTVLVDAFETIVLPRTVKRNLRLTNLFFQAAWLLYSGVGRLKKGPTRQRLLVAFAPMMLLVLIAMWACLIILGFALIEWGLHLPFQGASPMAGFPGHLYFSGVTFFTLGFGDITPITWLGRTMAVVEAGMGLGFLALIISYIPVLYSSFSRREVTMLLLDSKAGSNPTAAELLRRHAEAKCLPELQSLLKDWETFSAQLLESYLSYPMLASYRSQHDDQSWLTSLTAVMDGCALILTGIEGEPAWWPGLKFQAQSTFAMARHLVVDLAYILDAEPIDPKHPRLKPDQFAAILAELDALGLRLKRDDDAIANLLATRKLYEPYVQGLAKDLILDLPEWIPAHRVADNWQTSAWDGQHF